MVRTTAWVSNSSTNNIFALNRSRKSQSGSPCRWDNPKKLVTNFGLNLRVMKWAKKWDLKVLVFLPSIHWIYCWVEPKVLGNPFVVTSEFLGHFREENLLTLKGEYEEDYILEAPSPSKRVCYINHERGSRWMWMYNALISKLGVRVPFTHFQFTILE